MSATPADPGSGYWEGWNVDSSLAGWEPNTSRTNVSQVNSGGNPAGYLYTFGNVSESFDIGANSHLPSLTGNYDANKWIASFDLSFIEGVFDNAWLRFRYKSPSYNGWAAPIAKVFDSTWTSNWVVIDPDWTDIEARAAGWLPDNERSPGATPPPSFSETLSDVYSTEVRLSGEGYLRAGIDNFGLRIYVPIDIRPYWSPSKPNVFNLKKMSKKFWVAILSDKNFDALQVNPNSVRFGPGKAKPLTYRVKDANSDGFIDLVLKFKVKNVKFACGDTEASLIGKTYAEGQIQGIDSIKTKNCK